MGTVERLSPRGGDARQGAAAIEVSIVTPILLLLVMGCVDYGRFAYALIAVANAARAGAGVGIMTQYPDPTTGNGLANWQMSVCTAVADELGMKDDFTPAGLGDPNGYINSQNLYVQLLCNEEANGLWRA